MVQRGVYTYTHHNVIEDGLKPGQSKPGPFSFAPVCCLSRPGRGLG